MGRALLLSGPLSVLACGGTTENLAASRDGGSASPEGGSIVIDDPGRTDAGTWVDASPPPQLGAGSAVATTGPTDVWVVGNGPILHFDGTSWSSVFTDSMSTFGSLWANSPTDAWAVGYYPGPNSMLVGSIAHWNGVAWGDVTDAPPTNQLFAVWGSSASDVWVVGDEVVGEGLEAIVLHFNGSAWTVAYTESVQDFGRVWGSGPSDVWVSGLGGMVRFDGATWSKAGPTSATVHTFEGVWGTGPSDIWAWGMDDGGENGWVFHYDGDAWSAGTPIGASLSVSDMWGSSPADVWAVGSDGTTGYTRALMMHWDGQAWSVLPQASDAPVLDDLAGSGPDNVWAAGDAVLRLK